MIPCKLASLRWKGPLSHAQFRRHRPLLRASIGSRSSRPPNVSISDPPSPSNSAVISLAHPKDPAGQSAPAPDVSQPPESPPNTSSASTSFAPSAAPDVSNAGAPLPSSLPPQDGAPPPPTSNLPAPHVTPTIVTNPTYSSPPFHTYRFFAELEKTFPSPTARHLMRATRALLVDRIGRVKRDALTIKDLESVRILFWRVELRTYPSM